MARSPYIDRTDRLADVVAAIQAMGAYKFYKLDFASWSRRISGDDRDAARWEAVFREHPEFFRVDTTDAKASLVARRQRRRVYHVDLERDLGFEDAALYHEASAKGRLSRSPLSSDEIAMLIGAAVDLHARALEQRSSRRWWIPIATAILSGAFALIGAYLGTLKG